MQGAYSFQDTAPTTGQPSTAPVRRWLPGVLSQLLTGWQLQSRLLTGWQLQSHLWTGWQLQSHPLTGWQRLQRSVLAPPCSRICRRCSVCRPRSCWRPVPSLQKGAAWHQLARSTTHHMVRIYSHRLAVVAHHKKKAKSRHVDLDCLWYLTITKQR